MGPLALGVSMIPRLEAAAAASPVTIGMMGARLRALGHTVGSSAGDVVAWAKTNPGMSSTIIATAASVGLSLFGQEDEIPDDIREAMKQASLGNLTVEQALRVIGAGAVSQTLDLGLSRNADDMAVAADVLSHAKSVYGSVSRAIRAHSLHQAFFEMSREDVIAGFTHLRV
jgi:hypothetical protein